MNALSGSVSNEGMTAVAVGIEAVRNAETGDCFALGLDDTVSPHVI